MKLKGKRLQHEISRIKQLIKDTEKTLDDCQEALAVNNIVLKAFEAEQ